jgi:hypothetical protein
MNARLAGKRQVSASGRQERPRRRDACHRLSPAAHPLIPAVPGERTAVTTDERSQRATLTVVPASVPTQAADRKRSWLGAASRLDHGNKAQSTYSERAVFPGEGLLIRSAM